MKDINSVTEVGRLTADAELHTFENGNGVVQFTIAVNTSKKEGDKFVDEGNFFTVKYYGKNLEKFTSYLTKGKQICVDGFLKQDKWQKDGKTNSLVYIVATAIQLCSSGKASEQTSQSSNSPEDFKGEESNFPEDVPF